MTTTSRDALYPLFLGPHGENTDLLVEFLLEFLRDHVHWRRNFHPEDSPVIPLRAANRLGYQATVARMGAELQSLSTALNRSVPSSSPRYIGHMTSDVLLPALIAHMMTLPYNPNNVVDEVAPVTLDLEISAGLQLAHMLGFETDEDKPNCAFGHLTSGGTVANYEALNLQRALRHYPLAAAAALRAHGHLITSLDRDDWALANLPTTEVVALHEAMLALAASLPEADGRALLAAIDNERVETLGWAEFARRHPDWREPVVLVPATAHYSWRKGMKLIGLGAAQLREVPLTGMRMDADALAKQLDGLAAERTPVLAVVAVLGTTEFGTLDPVHEIVATCERACVPVHVDAAWGGYLTALFRNADGGFADHADVRSDFRYFPSKGVYESFKALARVDSVTIDPHKLGFVPFGAGAVVFRDHRALDLIALDADYVFDPEQDKAGYRDKFRQLGRYILEGSKSGAAAAGVYVSQRVVPPHRDGLGQVLTETIRATEHFYDAFEALAAELRDTVTLLVPFEPDTNLVCVAMNPVGNRDLATANRYTRRVFAAMKVDAAAPVQTKEFFGSYTRLTRMRLGDKAFESVLDALGLDDDPRQGGLFILRHTLMNPWLEGYVERYRDFLKRVLLNNRGRTLDEGIAAPRRRSYI